MYGNNMTFCRSLYLAFPLVAATNELPAVNLQDVVCVCVGGGGIMNVPTYSVRHLHLQRITAVETQRHFAIFKELNVV
jgi:hypothetical protein